MKKINFRFSWLIVICLAGIIFLAGCGLERSSTTYKVTVKNLAAAGQTVTYAVVTVNSLEVNGYNVTETPSGLSLTLSSKNFYSTSNDFSVPLITFNRLQIAYSVDRDSNNVLGAWTPAAIDTAVNIVLPRTASGEGTATVDMNALTPFSHMSEVADKIVVVTATPAVPLGYTFSLGLTTYLVVGADVLLSGTDENGNAVSTSFSTNINYQK